VAFKTFVVKVVSHCNLNCSYCYMYNLRDKTYLDQPRSMSTEVTGAMIRRIRSHASRHSVPYVHIILHGGEPLLMGRAPLESWVLQVRRGLSAFNPLFSLQSNGVLIDDAWIETLADLQVSVGISVDGPANFHDRYRVNHSGKGSYAEVVAAIRRLQEHPRGHDIFSSVMAVVNPDLPPRELFEFWQFLDVDNFDISLPHANHAFPPRPGTLSYGQWMIEFFDLWFDQNRADRHVRYFENILRMLFGYPISTDNIGGKPVDVVVVETDGGIEPTDAFKSCANGLTKLGMNVRANEFDELYSIAMINTLQAGAPKLCQTCQSCSLKNVCGGGYMPHRYDMRGSFDNPSVYCEDLKALISHMARRSVASLPSQLRQTVALK
jgi:uncharacterized protein